MDIKVKIAERGPGLVSAEEFRRKAFPSKLPSATTIRKIIQSGHVSGLKLEGSWMVAVDADGYVCIRDNSAPELSERALNIIGTAV